jgi:hypothetical protein
MNRLGNRAEQLIAVVAAWAIVLAPLTALSNCCCAARAAAAQATVPDQAAGDRLVPVSCCAAEPAEVCDSQPTPACCTPKAAMGQSLDKTSMQSCACQTTCCDTYISQATAIVTPAGQQVISLDWDALPVALLDELPWVTRSSWSEDAREPVFLSAHARCAMLCRWLN